MRLKRVRLHMYHEQQQDSPTKVRQNASPSRQKMVRPSDQPEEPEKRKMNILHRRVPVQIQMNTIECGAACLAMMLSYFGRKTSIAEIRERHGVGERRSISTYNSPGGQKLWATRPSSHTTRRRPQIRRSPGHRTLGV